LASTTEGDVSRKSSNTKTGILARCASRRTYRPSPRLSASSANKRGVRT
jgi:hypothetical protein